MWGKFEPILNATTISSVVSAILAALVAFNVPVTDEQRNAILALVAAVGAVFWVGAAVARQQVTPVEKVQENILPLVAPENKVAAAQSLETGVRSARADVPGA